MNIFYVTLENNLHIELLRSFELKLKDARLLSQRNNLNDVRQETKNTTNVSIQLYFSNRKWTRSFLFEWCHMHIGINSMNLLRCNAPRGSTNYGFRQYYKCISKFYKLRITWLHCLGLILEHIVSLKAFKLYIQYKIVITSYRQLWIQWIVVWTNKCSSVQSHTSPNNVVS